VIAAVPPAVLGQGNRNPMTTLTQAHPLEQRPALSELTREAAKIGILSFGGATAQIAMLHRLAVDERKWLDEQRFLRALSLCMLLPGPEAQQLATYIGWHARGVAGGLVMGGLFVLPGALLMLGLSFLYVLGTGIGFVDGLFLGIKAAVLAIVAQAVIKLAKRALKGKAWIALAIAAFAAFAFVNASFPLVIIAAALIGAILATGTPASAAAPRPLSPGRAASTAKTIAASLVAWWLPVALAVLVLGGQHVVVEVGLFFSQLAVLSFGGAYALLAWLADAAVVRGWLTTPQMMAGLGLAETTPGPTILVTQFVGFLAGFKQPGSLSPLFSATLAALMATWVTFAPSFLWIFAGAPWLDELLANKRVAGALQGITAAVLGAIAWLALWFALNVLFGAAGFLTAGLFRLPWPDWSQPVWPAIVIATIAMVLSFGLKQGMLTVIAISAALGVLARLALA
jgi:chromate transporter